MSSPQKKIAVLGAGISGLCSAYFLEREAGGNFSVDIFEKQPRIGGWIHTLSDEGYTFELGPHTLRRGKEYRALDELSASLGLDKKKIELPRVLRKYIQYQGSLHPVPESFLEWLGSPLFRGLKGSLVKGAFSTKCNSGSVEGFFAARFGKEFVDRLINPFCRGIWACPPEHLCFSSCFPSLKDLAAHNRPIASLFFQKKAPPSSSSCIYSFSGGLHVLCETIAKALNAKIHTSTPAVALEKQGKKIAITTKEGTKLFDHVVSTLPGHALCPLLPRDCPEEKAVLASLPYTDVTLVHLAWNKGALPYNGFGALAPGREESSLLGVIFTSSLFSDRTPNKGGVSLTYMFGNGEGSFFEKQCLKKAIEHAHKTFALSSHPDFTYTFCAAKAIYRPMPGHIERLRFLKRSLEKKICALTLSSTFVSGVSIYDCADYAKQNAMLVAKKHLPPLT